ncbi:hypothetical protein GDO78_018258 [Eleutherodactylus coqui]|uniref:Uncharacterized protein n=1 Tax=Eleutherodactylus coqui TaxID=57060 RepID=A0A8J6BEM7_ELECQ|nr:hypothetical protein GDO78_018258 [Eleutherodactylus coqui]
MAQSDVSSPTLQSHRSLFSHKACSRWTPHGGRDPGCSATMTDHKLVCEPPVTPAAQLVAGGSPAAQATAPPTGQGRRWGAPAAAPR